MGISEKVINMSEKLKRFTDLMQQIFELDKSDLDFGIYRIMNIRKVEIEKFLNERLPEMVAETLRPFAQGTRDELKSKLEAVEQKIADTGMPVSELPESSTLRQQYLQLQKQLAEGADLSALETDVYSALYNFFNRYYEEGDFISKRRYKEGVYAIPYEGEEVKLYWANQDQYYIKTSENFKDYTFLVGDYTVHFRLVDATTEQNNNKESADSKRVFMLFTEDEENYPGIRTFEYDPDGKELIIRRWLSESHLYSSAFTVTFTPDEVILRGAGWGHGVGLCQIGGAVMSAKGYDYRQILQHYYPGHELKTQ